MFLKNCVMTINLSHIVLKFGSHSNCGCNITMLSQLLESKMTLIFYLFERMLIDGLVNWKEKTCLNPLLDPTRGWIITFLLFLPTFFFSFLLFVPLIVHVISIIISVTVQEWICVAGLDGWRPHGSIFDTYYVLKGSQIHTIPFGMCLKMITTVPLLSLILEYEHVRQ